VADPIRFFFDFTSTFSYIAMQRIDALAARYGREADWIAVSLGHLFQAQGVTPPPMIPAKLNYLKIDFARSCEFEGLPSALPDPFPPDVKLARYTFYRLKARDAALSHEFARRVAMAVFGRGERVDSIEAIVQACGDLSGVTRDDVAAAATDVGAKRAVLSAIDAAKDVGMNGAPYMILDGEPFWGADRLGHLERRLASLQ
jgi:2-hydroxychromene-2-carboxylate isomerase